MIIYGIKWKGKGLSKQTDIENAYTGTTDKVLNKWFTAMASKGKPIIGLMTTRKVVFSSQNKVTDRCTFSKRLLKNLGNVW